MEYLLIFSSCISSLTSFLVSYVGSSGTNGSCGIPIWDDYAMYYRLTAFAVLQQCYTDVSSFVQTNLALYRNLPEHSSFKERPLPIAHLRVTG